jgi:tetratricopeptide (TPR) repeat protein
MWDSANRSARAASLACLIVGIASPARAQDDPRAALARGIEALHYFEYEEANEAFRHAHQRDASLVMACWGEAMTYHQTLWRHEDVAAGRAALARCGPTSATRAAKARSDTERAYLDAIDTLFGNGDTATRRLHYADRMAQLYADAPDDPDVASFYALALLGTMSRGLIGAGDAHEGHSRELAGSETQQRVNVILDKVLRSHPTHAGALHYLLHNNDDPDHAEAALPAARALARLAPDSSHARHMPAHIFLQLGAWQEAEASDAAAFDTSDAWVKRKGLPLALRSYHALAWREYELLQLGRFRDARRTLDEIEPVVTSAQKSGQLTLLTDLSTMRARYAIETAGWSTVARQSTFGNADELFAIGLGAARTNSADVAERARAALAARVGDEREGDLRPAIAIMERAVAATIAFASGRRDEALAILRAAADEEARLPAPLGLPEPIKPAPELLGELLIEAGRAADADAFFAASLRRNRKRTLSLAGRARAAAATGQQDRAREYYREVASNLEHADAELPMLAEARAALARHNVSPSAAPQQRIASRTGAIVAALLVATMAIAWLAIRRRRARRAAPVRTEKKGPPKRARSRPRS